MNGLDLQRAEELKTQLAELDYHYYTLGQSLVSDAEYDRRYAEYEALEAKYPELKTADSPTQRVGGPLLDGLEKFTHRTPLLSIEQKPKDLIRVKKWFDECKGMRQHLKLIVQPKLDGITLNVAYQNGHLIDAATRGTGYVGELVTEGTKTLRTIPLQIQTEDLIEVRGEAVTPFDMFMSTYLDDYSNARNFVAGTMRQLNPKLVAKRQPHVIMYDLGVGADAFSCDTEALAFLSEQGFKVAPTVEVETWEELEALLESKFNGWVQEKNGFNVLSIQGETPQTTYDYLVDGLVLKVADLDLRQELGMTAKGPRYYLAYKFESLQAETVLQSVDWQVGRTGKLTPVARLAPVELGGTTIENATMNNPEYMHALGVSLGDTVIIERANDVIPYLVGPADEEKDVSMSQPIPVPDVCPVCGSVLAFKGANLYCQDSSCPAQLKGNLLHAVKREALNLEGMGESLIDVLVAQGWVHHLYDLFNLPNHLDDLQQLPGYGKKKAQNILTQLENAKGIEEAWRILYALGLPHVGRSLSKVLMSHYSSIEDLLLASVEDLVVIEGIGAIKAQAIVEAFQLEGTKANLAAFKAHGLTLTVKAVEPSDFHDLLAGQAVAITGTLAQKRKVYQTYFESLGAKVSSSVSAKTAFVLIGADAGSKADKAYELQEKGATLIILDGDDAFETHLKTAQWPTPEWVA